MLGFFSRLKKNKCEHEPEELVRYILEGGGYDVLYQCSKCGEHLVEREIPVKEEDREVK